jgi:hypothetical protein
MKSLQKRSSCTCTQRPSGRMMQTLGICLATIIGFAFVVTAEAQTVASHGLNPQNVDKMDAVPAVSKGNDRTSVTNIAPAEQARGDGGGAATGTFCGDPNAGSCCVAQTGSPYCDDEECCDLICAQDSFCCTTNWDSLCAGAAQAQCAVCAVEIECPDGATDEGEPCGDDINGGCNSEPPIFSPISLGETICGNAWADGGTRDTDWYEIVTTETVEFTFCVTADFSTLFGLVAGPGDGDCDNIGGTVDPAGFGDPGEEVCVSVILGPGTWWWFVAPSFFNGMPCPGGTYYATLDGEVLVDDCGTPGTGSCCVANGTPFCDDEECCDLICDQDPFCCETEWDGACADAANDQCAVCDVPACGVPGTGDCCEAQTGSPFCENAACCECICACDAFCCTTNWDSLCAGMGLGGCGASNPDGPCADECSECLPELECGSEIAGDCCEANGTPFCDDEACCDLICDQDPFCCETEWDSACAEAANDQCEVCDVPGCGDEGTGDCCEAMPPGSGSPFCEDEECCELICAQDSFCCNVNWDSLCANAANEQCDVCQPDPEGCSLGFWKNNTDQWVGYDPDELFSDVFGTTVPPESDCCEAQVGSPGCDDPDCEAAVCAADPFCCNTNWDSLCASQAVNEFCVELCEEGTAGVEVFGDCTLHDVISSPSGGPNACSGTPQANNLGKQAVAALLNASSSVEYPLTEEEVIDAVVAAFEAWLDGAHHSVLTELKDELDEFNNIGCPDFNIADLNYDGAVDGNDLLILLNHWGSDSEESRDADLNRDGIVDGADLLILLENWGAQPPSWSR